MPATSQGKGTEFQERPGDLYVRPVGPIDRLYPPPLVQRVHRDQPATDEERKAITGPALARIRQRLHDRSTFGTG